MVARIVATQGDEREMGDIASRTIGSQTEEGIVAKKDENTGTAEACIEVAERMTAAWEEAIAESKGKLTTETRLLVGMRGALGAVRGDTPASWILAVISRALGYKGVKDEVEEPTS